jgi:hypothetical protein
MTEDLEALRQVPCHFSVCGVSLPPHLIVDLGIGRDWMATGDPSVGETDELRLLGDIAWGFIRTTGRDVAEADELLLPVRQRELKLLVTPASGRLG